MYKPSIILEESFINKTNKKWELINFCEFDKYAEQSYCAIHDEIAEKNLGDITKINEKEMSNFTWGCGGSPCQDFSVAGNQAGAEWTCKDCTHNYNPLEVHYTKRSECPKCYSTNIEKTRSSLIVELLRIIREKKPNVFLYENVKNLIGKKFKYLFDMFLTELGEYGYNCHYKVLNAKDYGVPQNRERVYLIIVKKEMDNGKFEFPKPFDNGIRLKDILEVEVDEKFYVSQDKVTQLMKNIGNKIDLSTQVIGTCHSKNDLSFATRDRVYNENCLSPTLTATMYKDAPKVMRKDKDTSVINVIGRILPESQKIHQNQEVYDSNNIIGTIKSSHYKDPPKVLHRIENSVQQIGNIVNTGNWDNPQRGRIYSADGCSPSLNCCGGGGLEPKIIQGAIRGRYLENGEIEQQLEIGENGYTNTITTVQKDNVVILDDTKSETFGGGKIFNICPTLRASRNGHKVINTENLFRIRKLTPKECFRLMGFSDDDFNNAKYEQEEFSKDMLLKYPNHKGKRIMEHGERMSNSQLYKQAGNSIVVDVLYYILVELHRAMPYLFEDVKLSSFFSGIGAFENALDKMFLHINSEKDENFTQSQVE